MRCMTAFVIKLILSVAILTAMIDGASAEGFVDVRIGGAITPNTEGSVVVAGVPPSPSFTVEFNPGVSVGIRGGYWLDSVPWLGAAFDLSYFDPEVEGPEPSLKLGVYPISALLMLRFPLLKSATYPHGRLQPYVGAGPSAFVTTAKIKLKRVGLEDNFYDTMVNLGLDARAGINFQFAGQNLPGSLAVFLEYRFTRFNVLDFKDNINDISVTLDLDRLDTHHIVAGVGFYF